MENMLETKNYRVIPPVLCLCAQCGNPDVLGKPGPGDGCLQDRGDLQVCPTEELYHHIKTTIGRALCASVTEHRGSILSYSGEHSGTSHPMATLSFPNLTQST